jgi:hypothetical protein
MKRGCLPQVLLALVAWAVVVGSVVMVVMD